MSSQKTATSHFASPRAYNLRETHGVFLLGGRIAVTSNTDRVCRLITCVKVCARVAIIAMSGLANKGLFMSDFICSAVGTTES